MSDRTSKKILVTGGAGYIGSHAAKALAMRGYIPVTYDNLVHGHRWAVQFGPLVQGDIGDKVRLLETLRQHEIAAVLHFAAFAYVGESMSQPERYYENNVTKSLSLLDAVMEAGVRHVVFSSSCATYGTPDRLPITEFAPQRPVNPYGETKLVFERALHWYAAAHGFTFAILRYFNAAGADFDGRLGEAHSPETHLIPLMLEAVDGRRTLEVYGDDYGTRDGTCVRDYIHVDDLATAHVQAVEHLLSGNPSITLNLGTGNGHTIKEVIDVAENVTGRKVSYRICPRRPGDPAVLVADPTQAGQVLRWLPLHSDMNSIIDTAWNWYSKYSGKKYQ